MNAVGVDVNTASPSLLARVAGVGPLLSRNIVEHRNANGPFATRKDLLKVPRLGAKAFEQCAGFLRITGGEEPLDASSVHPEAYDLARALQKAAAQQGRFEDMYQRMYQTQQSWAEQQVPMDETFRGFAVDLGLDMTAWDAAYQDPATLDRINTDVADGQTLGVQGTPTFFVNGSRLQPQSYQDLTGALDAALG